MVSVILVKIKLGLEFRFWFMGSFFLYLIFFDLFVCFSVVVLGVFSFNFYFLLYLAV